MNIPRPDLPTCEWVYFATPTCGSLMGTKNFILENNVIVSHAYNKLGQRMPNVQHVKPGDKILFVYGANSLYVPMFECTVAQSKEPVVTAKHTFNVLCRIDRSVDERLKASGYCPDSIVQRFTGITLSSLQDLSGRHSVRKPIGNTTLRRWKEVFAGNTDK